MISDDRLKKGLYWQQAWKLVEGCSKVSPGCDNFASFLSREAPGLCGHSDRAKNLRKHDDLPWGVL